MNAAKSFLQARNFLLAHREDYAGACAGFRWPAPDPFNWALDYFDNYALNNNSTALLMVDDHENEQRRTLAQLRDCSNRVANWLRGLGVRRGDRILVMLPSIVELWEITLAAMKLGAVLSPASPLLTSANLNDRVQRGGIRLVISDAAGFAKFADVPGDYIRVVVGSAPGWSSYENASSASAEYKPDAPTGTDDPLLLYFTSGTTAQPKMVLHTHRSYPIGHLSTLYWLGLREGDLHYNISSPGWAKQAWSSFFAPWTAGAAVFVFNQSRFDAKRTLKEIVRRGVTSLCAPPTVWRLLILEDLASFPVKLRELVSAGEPLNPEVIECVRRAWCLTIRDGYGQTETTCLIGNSPGQAVKSGSMGRPMPGYSIALHDASGSTADEGEIVVDLHPRPAGLMAGYLDNPERTAELLGGTHFRTSDIARRDTDGYLWYVGRADDVFKSSDYRISPFEIESALLEHAAVVEAAVVPSPDAIRLSVPKAYIVLRAGVAPSRETALDLFRFGRRRLAPYQRIRRLEFAELPKTTSGKIRRAELRQREAGRKADDDRRVNEFWEEDCPEV